MTATWRIAPIAGASIADIETALAHGLPWTGVRTDAWLLRRWFGQSSFLAYEQTLPIGIAIAMPDADQAHARSVYVDQVAVAPTHRGRGLLQALIDRCEAWPGAESIWLTVDPANPSIGCWSALGFMAAHGDALHSNWPVQRGFKGAGRDRVVFQRQTRQGGRLCEAPRDWSPTRRTWQPVV